MRDEERLNDFGLETPYEVARRAEQDPAPDNTVLPPENRDPGFISLLPPAGQKARSRRRPRASVAAAAILVLAISAAGVDLLRPPHEAPGTEPARRVSVPERIAGPLEARDAPAFEASGKPTSMEAKKDTSRRVKKGRARFHMTSKRGRRAPSRSSWALGAPAAGGARHKTGTGSSSKASKPATNSGPSTSSGNKTSKSKDATASKPKGPPKAPLFHLFKQRRNEHFYTNSASERDQKIANGYEFISLEGYTLATRQEGSIPLEVETRTAGWVYTEQRPGTIALHMLRGYNGNGVLYTTDGERMAYWQNNDGWNYMGIYGYVFPPN
jgi:hypothetical protein